ncbi:YjgF-like protein [Daldinia bambusicola]|nr:YjgF-like protein [Daldinia bambusicola]
MAGLPSYAYPGAGEWAREAKNYSQAIRVGDNIFLSGQGGWDRTSLTIKENLKDEVEQAFDNVDHVLKHAGGKGWSQVYRVMTYSTDIKATHDHIVENFKRLMPDHQPVWTEVGVKALGLDTMHIEIEVQAYDAEGAAEARKARV